MHFVEVFLADYFFIIVAGAATFVMITIKENRGQMIVRGLFAGISALVLGQLSGLFYYHERPFVTMETEAGALAPAINSFPSQHALLVFAAALVVWFATRNWRLGGILAFGAAAIGWARVQTLVHWPIDIVGSFIIVLVMTFIWYMVPLPRQAHNTAKWIDHLLKKWFPKLPRIQYSHKK